MTPGELVALIILTLIALALIAKVTENGRR
jgi:hypothetical protein